MERTKDNMTDLAEQVQRLESETGQPSPTVLEATTTEGQVVTLGHENPKTVAIKTSKNSFELPVGEILGAVARAVEKAFESLRKR